ncbi:PREDICTED: uncharacterized protein LOC105144685 isoform X2 [Acromyrmex echinatior]|uniref:uncharacterized protein LOC105144685 isoform X2 n=1 Tax=Acromyrmex echinatior TaxID=103372 RepID=UPI000580EDE4|nr:PREDICTED: uncharacterized protein LOC105144685 isoform X2 [Acromyrmex echinatior]
MALPGRAPRFVAFVFASWRPILVYSIYVHISLTGNPDRPALISSMPRLDDLGREVAIFASAGNARLHASLRAAPRCTRVQ